MRRTIVTCALVWAAAGALYFYQAFVLLKRLDSTASAVVPMSGGSGFERPELETQRSRTVAGHVVRAENRRENTAHLAESVSDQIAATKTAAQTLKVACLASALITMAGGMLLAFTILYFRTPEARALD
jgi:hypothetical protein